MSEYTLYRAASDDFAIDSISFAADEHDAREYLADANPGFGGDTLYVTTVTIEDAEILDISDSADPLTDLLDAAGAEDGGRDVYARIADLDIVDALHASGYNWVRVTDNYPVDCDTFTWLGWTEENDARMPVLVER